MALARTPGVVGRVGVFLVTVVLAAAADGERLGAAAAFGTIVALALHPRGLRVLARPGLWVFLLALALPPVMFTTPRDLAWAGGLAVSNEGLRLALAVVIRAMVIAVAAAGLVATVPVPALAGLLEACGLPGLGFTLGVALNALPLTTRTWATSARALRLRGGLARHRVRDVVLLAMTVIGNALRHADEVVEAAQARGYAPGRYRTDLPHGWRGDLIWVVACLVVAGIVVAW